jgi:putative protease
MSELKPDAFIMADPGLIHIVRQEYPNIVIHLSVQANNTNWAQVQFWHSL